MKGCKALRQSILSIVLLLFILFNTACSGSSSPSSPASDSPVEKKLKEFYNRLGGQSILGNIISPVLQESDYYYQYTEKVVLVFEPQAPSVKQYQLYPVGLEMGFQEPPEPMPADSDAVYINGFVVWSEALDFYNNWGRICKPISSLHYNEEFKRFEQFFECFGVYRSDDESIGVIHLLDYGAWKCGEPCITNSRNSAGYIPTQLFPDTPTKQDVKSAEANIVIAADRVGRAITGFPLTSTYLSDDGHQYLKIYENVVFAVDRDNPTRAYVLAITRDLNIKPGKVSPIIKEPGAKFTAVEEDLGYTVRAYFYNFLALHGSYDTSGEPIMNEYALNNIVNRQCFENICLDYHIKAGNGLKVRPAPLGYIFKELYFIQEVNKPSISENASITIHSWEVSSLISSDQNQEIGAAIYENFIAIPDVQVIMSVRMPDNTWVDYGPQATDSNGQTVFIIPPINAPNSTIILYQVCLYGIEEARNFCVMEDFTIWGNP